MLGLVMHGELALVKGWMLVDLPHLEVVDFFHHWFPEPDPCIDEPIRYLQCVKHKPSEGFRFRNNNTYQSYQPTKVFKTST